jgi:hypothetical protein
MNNKKNRQEAQMIQLLKILPNTLTRNQNVHTPEPYVGREKDLYIAASEIMTLYYEDPTPTTIDRGFMPVTTPPEKKEHEYEITLSRGLTQDSDDSNGATVKIPVRRLHRQKFR